MPRLTTSLLLLLTCLTAFACAPARAEEQKKSGKKNRKPDAATAEVPIDYTQGDITILPDGTPVRADLGSFKDPSTSFGILTLSPSYSFTSFSGKVTQIGSESSLYGALDIGLDAKFIKNLGKSFDGIALLGLRLRSFKAPKDYTIEGSLSPLNDLRIGGLYRISEKSQAGLLLGITGFESLLLAEGGVVELESNQVFNVGLLYRHEVFSKPTINMVTEGGFMFAPSGGMGFHAKLEENFHWNDRNMIGAAVRFGYNSITVPASQQTFGSLSFQFNWTMRLGSGAKASNVISADAEAVAQPGERDPASEDEKKPKKKKKKKSDDNAAAEPAAEAPAEPAAPAAAQ